jgi:uncharacterized protein
MNDAYDALLAKVRVFTEVVGQRRASDLACGAGCSACCEAWLTTNATEAAAIRRGLTELEPSARTRVRQRGLEQQARERSGSAAPRCAMLEDDGTCAIYESRPLVCRTQGHALRYPVGFIPASAVRARTANGEVTYCPLNYTSQPPGPEDVLDTERVDLILAVIDTRHTAAEQLPPERRYAISALAAAAADPDDRLR